MLVQELSCIEVLLNHLVNNTDLNKEIFADFTSTLTFDTKKSNLFNVCSINNLIRNYDGRAPFPLVPFVQNGTIKGIYDTPTLSPVIDPKYAYDEALFLKSVVEALKNDNYLLDDDNSVFVSSEKVETTLPQVWLYRLSEGYKRTKYSRFYFFNKTKEADISDKNSLIDYLRCTKTFLVTLTSNNRTDFDIEFAKAEALTNNEVRNEPVVKVEQLIEIFKKNINPHYEVEIGRYKLTDLFFIVAKAEAMGKEFYTKPLEEQQKYINEWLIEFLNSNVKANEAAQEYLLLGKKEEPQNKKEVIAGLINLYFEILSKIEMDFNDVSLTDLKIIDHIPEELQANLGDRKELTKILNKLIEDKQAIKDRIESFLALQGKKDTSSEVEELIKAYRAIEEKESLFQQRINTLQATIREQQSDSILDLSFANNEIIKLLVQAAKEGRVYLNNNGSTITFELYNNSLGQTTFKATIKTLDFLTLVENINYSLKENYKTRKN